MADKRKNVETFTDPVTGHLRIMVDGVVQPESDGKAPPKAAEPPKPKAKSRDDEDDKPKKKVDVKKPEDETPVPVSSGKAVNTANLKVDLPKKIGEKEPLPYDFSFPTQNYSISLPEHYFTGKEPKKGEEVKYREIQVIKDGKVLPLSDRDVAAYIVYNSEQAPKLRAQVAEHNPSLVDLAKKGELHPKDEASAKRVYELQARIAKGKEVEAKEYSELGSLVSNKYNNVTFGVDHAHSVRGDYSGAQTANGVGESNISAIQADMQMHLAASAGVPPYSVQESEKTMKLYRQAMLDGKLPTFGQYGMGERGNDVNSLNNTLASKGMHGINVSNHINGSGKHDNTSFIIHKGAETGQFAANVISQMAETGTIAQVNASGQAQAPGLWGRWGRGVQNNAQGIFLIEYHNADHSDCEKFLESASSLEKQSKAVVGGVLETYRQQAAGGMDVKVPDSQTLAALEELSRSKAIAKAAEAKAPVYLDSKKANFSIYTPETNTPRNNPMTTSGFPIPSDKSFEVTKKYPYLCAKDGIQPTAAVAMSSGYRTGDVFFNTFVGNDGKKMPFIAVVPDVGTLAEGREFDATKSFAEAVTSGGLSYDVKRNSLIYPHNGLDAKKGKDTVANLNVLTQNAVLGRLDFGLNKDGIFRVGEGKVTPESDRLAENMNMINCYNAGLITKTQLCQVTNLDNDVMTAAGVPEKLEVNRYYVDRMRDTLSKYSQENEHGLLGRVAAKAGIGEVKPKYPEANRMLAVVDDLVEFSNKRPTLAEYSKLNLKDFVSRETTETGRDKMIASATRRTEFLSPEEKAGYIAMGIDPDRISAQFDTRSVTRPVPSMDPKDVAKTPLLTAQVDVTKVNFGPLPDTNIRMPEPKNLIAMPAVDPIRTRALVAEAVAETQSKSLPIPPLKPFSPVMPSTVIAQASSLPKVDFGKPADMSLASASLVPTDDKKIGLPPIDSAKVGQEIAASIAADKAVEQAAEKEVLLAQKKLDDSMRLTKPGSDPLMPKEPSLALKGTTDRLIADTKLPKPDFGKLPETTPLIASTTLTDSKIKIDKVAPLEQAPVIEVAAKALVATSPKTGSLAFPISGEGMEKFVESFNKLKSAVKAGEVLKHGDTGEEVKALQVVLNQIETAKNPQAPKLLPVTGNYLGMTAGEVGGLQADLGLKGKRKDNKFGSETFGELEKAMPAQLVAAIKSKENNGVADATKSLKENGGEVADTNQTEQDTNFGKPNAAQEQNPANKPKQTGKA